MGRKVRFENRDFEDNIANTLTECGNSHRSKCISSNEPMEEFWLLINGRKYILTQHMSWILKHVCNLRH